MADPIPQTPTYPTRRAIEALRQHGQYLRAHAHDQAEHDAARAVVGTADHLLRLYGDLFDALDRGCHSAAYDWCDQVIDPCDEPIRDAGGYRPRKEGRT